MLRCRGCPTYPSDAASTGPEAMGGSDIYAAPAFLDAQRPIRDAVPLSLLGALRLPSLCFARESSGTACCEERCAGSFWTNGVHDDASKMVASVLHTASNSCLSKSRSSHSSKSLPFIFLLARDGLVLATALSCSTAQRRCTTNTRHQTGRLAAAKRARATQNKNAHTHHMAALSTSSNGALHAADASPCKARTKTQKRALDHPRRIQRNAAAEIT